jgi:transcriptional regulator with XRE-family HTH domain
MYYYGYMCDTFVKTFQKPGDSMTANSFSWLQLMSFSAKVIALRKARGLTQQGLADLTDIHIQQIKRYEAGTSEPSAEALRKIATSLHVTTDSLLFEDGERGPNDELRLQFEAVAAMPDEEKELAKSMLEAIILKNQVAGAVRQLSSTPATKAAAKGKKPASKRLAHAGAHR